MSEREQSEEVKPKAVDEPNGATPDAPERQAPKPRKPRKKAAPKPAAPDGQVAAASEGSPSSPSVKRAPAQRRPRAVTPPEAAAADVQPPQHRHPEPTLADPQDSELQVTDGPTGPSIAPRRLSGFDFATWRSAANDPAMRSPVIGLVVLDSSPDWNRLVERFDRASRVAPVLRQRVIEGPSDILNPRLVIDKNFDLGFHMRRFRVAEPGNWDQVLDETRRQSMTDFDMARPLWRVTLLEGLRGGRAVLIVKLHHAIADGQGAMMLGATTIDLDPNGIELGPMPPAPVAENLDTTGFLSHAMKDASGMLVRTAREMVDAAVPLAAKTLTDPFGLVEDALSVARSVARFASVPSRPLSPLMTGRSINYHFVTFDLGMTELKAVARANDVNLNDAFMAGVTGGLRIYHERRGEPVDYLRANMPISLRDPERPAHNAVTVARFEVPVGEADPAARMHVIHDTVAQWRREPALHLVDPLAEVGSRVMPQELITAAAQRSDFTASNVPGVPVPVWVAGAKVLAMYPMAGTIGAATNITLLSYNGTAAIGVATDDAAIPDRAVFAACLGEGFAEVVGHPVAPSDPLAAL